MKNKQSLYISMPRPFQIPLSKKKTYSPKTKILKNFSVSSFVKNELNHLQKEKFKKELKKSFNTAEKILNIFKNEDLLLGPKSNIELNQKQFLSKLNYFIENKKPILFTLTQVAFKIPNPLKITSKVPDLGELAFLAQLHDIVELVKEIYRPGIRIIILGESYIFYDIVGISRNEADMYFKQMKKWLADLKWNKEIILTDLKKLERKIDNFKAENKKNLKELQKGWKNNNQKIVEEVQGVINTLYLSMNTRKYNLDTLSEVYDKNIKNEARIESLRKKIYKETLKQSLPYIAHHKAIKTSNLADKLFPNNIALSCTFSPGALCFPPINKYCKLYSYHGVPLLKNGIVQITYEYDLKRTKNITAYYLPKQKYPFYFS